MVAVTPVSKAFVSKGGDLGDILRKEMQENGFVSVGDFHHIAMQHETLGYYRQADVLGEKGDFTTAPLVSQMFGEVERMLASTGANF